MTVRLHWRLFGRRLREERLRWFMGHRDAQLVNSRHRGDSPPTLIHLAKTLFLPARGRKGRRYKPNRMRLIWRVLKNVCDAVIWQVQRLIALRLTPAALYKYVVRVAKVYLSASKHWALNSAGCRHPVVRLGIYLAGRRAWLKYYEILHSISNVGIQACRCAYFKAKAAYFMSCSDCFAQLLFHAFDVVLIAPLA